MSNSIRHKLGALLYDMPRYVRDVVLGGRWAAYRNRRDVADTSEEPRGLRLRDRMTSSLHLCNQWPSVGRDLFRRAVKEWPFQLTENVAFSEDPIVSVIIPHRGTQRKPLLEATIRSFAACTEVPMECIVVEQSRHQELGSLPGNTRVVHAPTRLDGDPWHKTYAYNVGAAQSRGSILICHDGDVLVPREYPARLVELINARSLDVAFCQRFLFYLTESGTKDVLEQMSLPRRPPGLVEIRQNWVGGTLGIRRDAFWKIGGFDEEFVGWTGEDTEFHDRCQLLNGWFHGYVPFIHLWHPPQTEKVGPARQAQSDFTNQKLQIPRAVRVDQLMKSQSTRTP